MEWLRFVLGVGVAWLMSIVIAVAGMELGHRIVLTTERGETTEPDAEHASTVYVGNQRDPARSPTRF